MLSGVKVNVRSGEICKPGLQRQESFGFWQQMTLPNPLRAFSSNALFSLFRATLNGLEARVTSDSIAVDGGAPVRPVMRFSGTGRRSVLVIQ